MVRYLVPTLISLASGICALRNIKSTDQSGTHLQFNSNGTFQLSIFEDLHYGEGKLSVLRPLHNHN